MSETNESIQESILEEVKSDNAAAAGCGNEQWDKLLGNGTRAAVLRSQQLPVPRMEARRRSSSSILGSLHKSLRMSIGSKTEANGHVFSRWVGVSGVPSFLLMGRGWRQF